MAIMIITIKTIIINITKERQRTHKHGEDTSADVTKGCEKELFLVPLLSPVLISFLVFSRLLLRLPLFLPSLLWLFTRFFFLFS